jgi:hypothetical protein
VDVGAIRFGYEGGKAEAFFEADDAVLDCECAFSTDTGHHEEDDGQDYPPDVSVLVGGPVMDGEVDREDDVEKEQRKNDEVKRRKVAGVILKVLRGWHRWSFPFCGPGFSIAFGTKIRLGDCVHSHLSAMKPREDGAPDFRWVGERATAGGGVALKDD